MSVKTLYEKSWTISSFNSEKNLQCLNSRYFHPKLGRFINADNYISTDTGFYIYAYCNDQIINYANKDDQQELRCWNVSDKIENQQIRILFQCTFIL